jgi:hypothetical protein
MFVLDTNHVSELTYRTAAGLRLLQRLDAADSRNPAWKWIPLKNDLP